MIDDAIKQAMQSLSLNPGASEKDIDELLEQLGITPPMEYLDLLRYSNGFIGVIELTLRSSSVIYA